MTCESGTSVRVYVQDFYRHERAFAYRLGRALLVLMLTFVLLAGFAAWAPELKAAQRIQDGVYVIASAADDAFVLDAAGGHTTVGTNVQLYHRTDRKWPLSSENQCWKINYDAKTKSYKIVGLLSGKALGTAKVKDSNVQLASTPIQWAITTDAKNLSTLTSDDGEKVLDLKGGKAANGSNIQLYKPNSSVAQKWHLYRVPSQLPSNQVKTDITTEGIATLSWDTVPYAKEYQVWAQSSGEDTFADNSNWFALTTVRDTHCKVSGLGSGFTYRLRVFALGEGRVGATGAAPKEFMLAPKRSDKVISKDSKLQIDGNSFELRTVDLDSGEVHRAHLYADGSLGAADSTALELTHSFELADALANDGLVGPGALRPQLLSVTGAPHYTSYRQDKHSRTEEVMVNALNDTIHNYVPHHMANQYVCQSGLLLEAADMREGQRMTAAFDFPIVGTYTRKDGKLIPVGATLTISGAARLDEYASRGKTGNFNNGQPLIDVADLLRGGFLAINLGDIDVSIAIHEVTDEQIRATCDAYFQKKQLQNYLPAADWNDNGVLGETIPISNSYLTLESLNYPRLAVGDTNAGEFSESKWVFSTRVLAEGITSKLKAIELVDRDWSRAVGQAVSHGNAMNIQVLDNGTIHCYPTQGFPDKAKVGADTDTINPEGANPFFANRAVSIWQDGAFAFSESYLGAQTGWTSFSTNSLYESSRTPGVHKLTYLPHQGVVENFGNPNEAGNFERADLHKDDAVALPMVQRRGYSFKGWYRMESSASPFAQLWEESKTKDEAFSEAEFEQAFGKNGSLNKTALLKAGSDTYMPDDDLYLHAVWVRKTAQLNFDMNGHGKQVDSQTLGFEDKTQEPPAPQASGWQFGGWYRSDSFDEVFEFGQTLEQDQTVHAKWIPAVWKVSIPTALSYTNQRLGKVMTYNELPIKVAGWLGSAHNVLLSADTPKDMLSVGGAKEHIAVKSDIATGKGLSFEAQADGAVHGSAQDILRLMGEVYTVDSWKGFVQYHATTAGKRPLTELEVVDANGDGISDICPAGEAPQVALP